MIRRIIEYCMIYVFGVILAYDMAQEAAVKSLGEKEFFRIKERANMQHHGTCWHKALRTIHNNCKDLNDEKHSILALNLANCFLESSGHATYKCHLGMSEIQRRECINQMSDRAFGVYNEFYIHASHMCFYLNHEIWKADTQNTIENLYTASSQMKEQLLQSSEMQDAMLASQKESLELQSKLLDHGKELGSVIKSSSESVMNMISDFQESIHDQKELFFQMFSYVRSFQNWIIGEVSWFQSVIYYTVCCILSALFSASKKTANARIALFVIQSLNVIIERMLVQYYNNEQIDSVDKQEIAEFIWTLRKAVWFLCVANLLYTWYTYKDEYVENYRVLRRIENQLNSLKDYETTKTVSINHKENELENQILYRNLQDHLKTVEIKKSPIRSSKRLAVKRMKETTKLH